MFRKTLAALAAVIFSAAPALADAADDLAALIDEIRAFDIAESPYLAAREGDREAMARLPDVSLETEERRNEAHVAFRERAAAIPEDELGEQDVVSRGLLLYMLDGRIRSFDFDESRIPFLNDSGFFDELAYVARSTPIRNAADADAQIARLNALPDYFAQHTENMRRGIETGFVQPQLVVDRVIAIVEAMQVPETENVHEHRLFEPYADLPASIAEDERARIESDARAALDGPVRAAYADLLTFLRDEYRPASRADSIGAVALPQGDEWYAELVRHFTSLPDATPESIHQTGLEEVARIRAEMNAIIEEVAFDGTFEEFLEFLRTDEQFYAETPEELLMHASRIAKRIDGMMPAWFATLPRLPYGVLPVPDAIAPAYTTGRYWQGDPEQGVAGNYMVNTYDLPARPLYELPSLTAHEAVPGHHHQIALSQEIEGVPDFRNEMYITPFGEGWALYTERLAEEMGVYQTPYERFGRLSYEMWRACRLVVDTGIHAMGWNREQAEACFRENSALSDTNIVTEVDRYIAWPGQALGYKVGEMTIVRLRADAEERLGADFDIRRFHDAVLLNGAVTLNLLEAQVERWVVAEEEAAANEAE